MDTSTSLGDLDQPEFHLPSYLLKTAYGEELYKKLSTPSTSSNDRSITTKLSALGILGNMPSKYLTADYDHELASIFSSSNSNQSTSHSSRGRNDNAAAIVDEDDDIHDDDLDEAGVDVVDDDDDDESEEDVVRNIHYGDEMDVDFDDDDEVRPFTTRSGSRRNSRKSSRSSKLQSLSSSKNPFSKFKYSLPSKWEPSTNRSLIVANNGLTLKIDHSSNNFGTTSAISKNYDYLVTKTNNSIPVKVGVFYFETKILSVTNNNLKNNSDVTIGFMNSSLVNVNKMPGLEMGSYGFNGSDGNIICSQSTSRRYNCKFGQADIIGCGVNFATKSIFYTKNGVYLGVAFTDINKPLTPIIGLKNGNSITSNFGQHEFIFDIDGYINDEKLRIYKKIFTYTKDKSESSNKLNTNTDKEIPNLLQNLVSSYFNHLGYIDISKTFLQEVKNEQVNESLVNNFNKVETISTIDENNLKIRQQIRKYLISGDIDSAIKLTNLNFPKVFTKNEEILFKLNCNKFIQLIKKIQIDEAIEFGQSLREKYNENSKFQEFLNDIFSLLAFENPKESEFGFLLNDDELLKISDELNSEILKSLGKSSISNLEKLIKHNKSLLHILNEKNQLDSLLITSDDFGL